MSKTTMFGLGDSVNLIGRTYRRDQHGVIVGGSFQNDKQYYEVADSDGNSVHNFVPAENIQHRIRET